jgi:hypothetical protein
MDRRGFLASMLAACAAPAIVRAGALMRINPNILVPSMIPVREMMAYNINQDAMWCRLEMLLVDALGRESLLHSDFHVPVERFAVPGWNGVAKLENLDPTYREPALADLLAYAEHSFPGHRVLPLALPPKEHMNAAVGRIIKV